MKMQTLIFTFGMLALAACTATEPQSPLTSNKAQDAKVREKSAQVHTVLMTLNSNEIENQRDLSSVTEEPGDGADLAIGPGY